MLSISAFGACHFVAQPFDCSKNEVAIETLEVVTDNKDPDEAARPAAPALRCLPEVDDQVLVAFAHADLRRPLVLGSLWNPGDKPPESSR